MIGKHLSHIKQNFCELVHDVGVSLKSILTLCEIMQVRTYFVPFAENTGMYVNGVDDSYIALKMPSHTHLSQINNYVNWMQLTLNLQLASENIFNAPIRSSLSATFPVITQKC